MAVKDDGLHYPTEAIISKRARKHYRTPVHSQHWQLRSLITAEKRHIVYFPGGNGGNHIQRLNTLTHECETIKLLNFAPRCIVSKRGWLCCGSEKGEFAAIKLDDDDAEADYDVTLGLDPATRLPGGMAYVGDESVFSLLSRARRSHRSLVAKGVKLAKDRVNCITIWLPPLNARPADNAYPTPVAVLANNDCTVTLVSLDGIEGNESPEPLDIVTYPDYVNRAIISPDGGLLIAILDDPYLYVHERVNRGREGGGFGSSNYCWEEKQTLLLKSQIKGDRSDSRGSFAACFSESGNFLAVGTQHGTISIFDANLLTDLSVNPLIRTFQSSRPQSGPGAIRDMAFCPGPFDLLAWTEDRGHIGVADMRTDFLVRQIIDINADAEFEHVSILDRNTVDPRLLDRRRDGPWEHPYSGSNLDSGRDTQEGSRRRGVEGIDSLNHPLTANELLVLEAIQGDRQRRDRVQRTAAEEDFEERRQRLSSVVRDVIASSGGGPGEGAAARPTTVSRTNDLLGNYRERRNERASERAMSARQLLHASARGQQRRPEQRLMERIGDTVAAMREQRDRQDTSYPSVLDILQARERTTTTEGDDDASLLVPLVNQVVNRWEESALRGTLATDHGVFEVPPSPDNTAGLSWSEDGRTLFVGAEKGIYQFEINVHGRQFSPSITAR